MTRSAAASLLQFSIAFSRKSISHDHTLKVVSGGCSFYPLYPPALGSFLDSSLGGALRMGVTPDVLLLPSDLAPFAKLLPATGTGVAQVRFIHLVRLIGQ